MKRILSENYSPGFENFTWLIDAEKRGGGEGLEKNYSETME